MSRKDYVALARELAAAHPSRHGEDSPDARNTWQRCVQYVADACHADNPRFDRPKFYAACNPA